MPDLPKQSAIQAKFDAASEAGVSPCMWIPPEWEVVLKSGGVLPDNSRDNELFNDDKVIEEWRKHMSECAAMKAPKGPESAPQDDTWPNPFSNFEHIDDEEFSARSVDLVAEKIDPGPDGEEMYAAGVAVAKVFETRSKDILNGIKGDRRMFRKAVKVLQAKAFAEPSELERVAALIERQGQPEHIREDILDALGGNKNRFDGILSVLRGCGDGYTLLNRRDTVDRLREIVGPQSAGMKRLAQVFEWVLWRTTVLMQALNAAVKKSSDTEYNQARTNYINFVRDLDDHEPGKSNDAIDLTEGKGRSGYGGALKWNCIEPVIYQGRIIGARAVIKWNPHSSSSGFPLPHE